MNWHGAFTFTSFVLSTAFSIWFLRLLIALPAQSQTCILAAINLALVSAVIARIRSDALFFEDMRDD